MVGFFLLLIVQGILIGILCSYVAGQKNRSKGNWFLLGLLFSLLALIALAAIPSLSKEKGKHTGSFSTNPSDNPDTRKCPYCAEFVKAEAKICRFCQKELPPIAIPSVAPEVAPPNNDEQLMKEFGVTFDGERYCFESYRYDKLADAITYAKLQATRHS